MTVPRVLVFVEDPGAANGVLGLAKALAARDVDARVVAAEPALGFMERSGGEALLPVAAGESAASLIDRHSPSVILVGTSENPRSLGLALVDAAKARGVPCAGFVDALPNAAFRFRGTSADPLAHCPDVLLVPDTFTRDAFVALGVPEPRVRVTGHPHYDAVLDLRARLEQEGRASVRRRALPGARADALVVTFVSEISTGFDPAQFARSAEYSLHGRGERDGRTEIVLEELIDAVRKVCPAAHLVLRLHPKNTREELGGLVDEVDETSAGGSALDVVFASDLVAGMTSTLLLEANLLGRPTLSIVPAAREKEWLPTIRAGITPCATTRDDLERELAAWCAAPAAEAQAFATSGALVRVVDALISICA